MIFDSQGSQTRSKKIPVANYYRCTSVCLAFQCIQMIPQTNLIMNGTRVSMWIPNLQLTVIHINSFTSAFSHYNASLFSCKEFRVLLLLLLEQNHNNVWRKMMCSKWNAFTGKNQWPEAQFFFSFFLSLLFLFSFRCFTCIQNVSYSYFSVFMAMCMCRVRV